MAVSVKGSQGKEASGVAEEKHLYHIESLDKKDLSRRFLEAMGKVLHYSNYKSVLDLYSRIHMKCSRCTTTCPVYQATGDPKDIPCYRTGLLLKIYKRYFTMAGHLNAKYSSAFYVRDKDISELIDLLYRCTACRRCMLECPMGMDHGLITHFGRYVMSEIRLPPRALQVSTRAQLEGPARNTSAIPLPALQDTIEFLEEELLENTGRDIKFPIDNIGAKYAFFAPVSDYMMEADTLMGNAAVLNAAGDQNNWTIGSGNYDAINYGLFYSDWIFERVIKELVAEARRLKADTILIGECGHATRSAKVGVPLWGGKNAPKVVNCIEYLYEKVIEGKIKLRPNTITERVTYHDPCNLARMGQIVDQPRYLIKQFCSDFVEMTPGGRYNYCCGGGGGTVSIDEMHDFRMEIGGKTKVDQIVATGAKYLIAPCANCKKQLGELIRHYELDVELVGLHDILQKAIIWDE